MSSVTRKEVEDAVRALVEPMKKICSYTGVVEAVKKARRTTGESDAISAQSVNDVIFDLAVSPKEVVSFPWWRVVGKDGTIKAPGTPKETDQIKMHWEESQKRKLRADFNSDIDFERVKRGGETCVRVILRKRRLAVEPHLFKITEE